MRKNIDLPFNRPGIEKKNEQEIFGMQEATMSAPRECRSYVKKKKHATQRVVFDRRDAAVRAILRVLFTLSNSLSFFFSPRRVVPCRAGNSRGRQRNIFPWTWVRADMWNETRFAG